MNKAQLVSNGFFLLLVAHVPMEVLLAVCPLPAGGLRGVGPAPAAAGGHRRQEGGGRGAQSRRGKATS